MNPIFQNFWRTVRTDATIAKKPVQNPAGNRAGERGIHHVLHGANADDLDDYRPGLQAAVGSGHQGAPGGCRLE